MVCLEMIQTSTVLITCAHFKVLHFKNPVDKIAVFES